MEIVDPRVGLVERLPSAEAEATLAVCSEGFSSDPKNTSSTRQIHIFFLVYTRAQIHVYT